MSGTILCWIPKNVTLDIILPTYNRATLLGTALDSLIEARRPQELSVTVFVVDNNSKDETAEVVRAYQQRLPWLRYIFETQQGSSAALNAGIRGGTGELVAMINDDEEVDVHWFEVIQELFQNTSFDFAGGPYRPRWGAGKPDWVCKEFGAVVGWVDGGDTAQQYGPAFAGMLMGGNAVIKRNVLNKVGPYNTTLGRIEGLGACEDEDMFQRLLAKGFRGLYVPDLVIYHHIPAERMTRRYHRRWCWGRGTSMGILARTTKANATELFGIPRWKIRYAAVGAWRALKGRLRSEGSNEAFWGELRVWDLAGYIHGKFFRSV
jgi:glucosyl-dolichyl phosphate glucuronosyltransferase